MRFHASFISSKFVFLYVGRFAFGTTKSLEKYYTRVNGTCAARPCCKFFAMIFFECKQTKKPTYTETNFIKERRRFNMKT